MYGWMSSWANGWVGLVGVDLVVIGLLIITDMILEKVYSPET